MKLVKALTLFVVFSMLVSPLLLFGLRASAANPIYFSVEPVAIPPLMNTNSSINGLELPATPSPVGQNFTVEIHLIGASSANVSGVEVNFPFGNILTYAVPTGFTNNLGMTGGVLTGSILYGVSAGFYDKSGTRISNFPYTGAVYYEVAAASTGTPWNGADGLVANITFQIVKQPLGSNGETTVNLPLTLDTTDLVDQFTNEISHDVVQGTLTIDATPAAPVAQYGLSVNVVGNGTVTQNPFSTTYASGTNVTLTAVPGTGWTFQGWGGDVTGTQNPVNITMDGNKTVTATFTQPAQYYNLTVNIIGNGTVTQNPFNTTYLSGSIVTLSAAPSVNWTFSGWSGDLTGAQNPTNVTMNGNKTVTATFVQVSLANYSLTINVVGNGTVTQNPFNTTYLSGSIVTLSAAPSVNWTFSGWSGDLTGTQNPVNITMNGNKTVTATFVQVSLANYYTLTLNIVGNGTVTQNLFSLTFDVTYASGAVVTLAAVPGPGWSFSGWSGDVTSGQNPMKVTMDGNKTVTATFTEYDSPHASNLVLMLMIIMMSNISQSRGLILIVLVWILWFIFRG